MPWRIARSQIDAGQGTEPTDVIKGLEAHWPRHPAVFSAVVSVHALHLGELPCLAVSSVCRLECGQGVTSSSAFELIAPWLAPRRLAGTYAANQCAVPVGRRGGARSLGISRWTLLLGSFRHHINLFHMLVQDGLFFLEPQLLGRRM